MIPAIASLIPVIVEKWMKLFDKSFRWTIYTYMMKVINMTLKEFNKKYKYVSDSEKYNFSEVWAEPKEENGVYEGDCEDYCLTLKKLIPQFKNWDLYFCKINGNGHCILYKNGDVIDCNIKSITTFEQYCKIYKVTEFKKYNWFMIFSKLLFAKIFKTIGRIND